MRAVQPSPSLLVPRLLLLLFLGVARQRDGMSGREAERLRGGRGSEEEVNERREEKGEEEEKMARKNVEQEQKERRRRKEGEEKLLFF